MPLYSQMKMMTSSTVFCQCVARAAQKCSERCAAYPPHQSTQFKGQRTIMNIWWKKTPRLPAAVVLTSLFLPHLICNQAAPSSLTFSRSLALFECSDRTNQQRRAKKTHEGEKRLKLTPSLDDCLCLLSFRTSGDFMEKSWLKIFRFYSVFDAFNLDQCTCSIFYLLKEK